MHINRHINCCVMNIISAIQRNPEWCHYIENAARTLPFLFIDQRSLGQTNAAIVAGRLTSLFLSLCLGEDKVVNTHADEYKRQLRQHSSRVSRSRSSSPHPSVPETPPEDNNIVLRDGASVAILREFRGTILAELILRVISEIECLIEIFFRSNRLVLWFRRSGTWRSASPQRTGWLVVLALTLLKSILRIYINRRVFSAAVKSLISHFSRSLPTQRTHLVTRDRQSPGLIIPRVAFSNDARHSPSLRVPANEVYQFTPTEYLAVAVEGLQKVRPFLWSVLAFVHSRPTPIRRALQPYWRPWGLMVLIDFAGLCAGVWVREKRRPVIVIQSSGETGTPPSTHEADAQRISTSLMNLGSSVLKDPFFSVVLRQFIVDHLVNGWFNRWVPIIGSFLASHVEYQLAMHSRCFLYSAD